MTRFAERKAFAIAAVERLTYAADTDAMTMDLVAVIRAVAGLMPTDEADGALEAVADDLAYGVRTAGVDPDLAFWNLADYRHEQRVAA